MKEKKYFTMPGRVMAFLLLIIALIVFPVGAVGTYYMVSEGYYITEPQLLKEKYIGDYLEELGRKVLFFYDNWGEYQANEVLKNVSAEYIVMQGDTEWNTNDYEKKYEWWKEYNYTHSDIWSYSFDGIQEYRLGMMVPRKKACPDYITMVCFLTEYAYGLRILLPLLAVLGLIAGVGSCVYLMCGAGWKVSEGKQTSGAMGFVPTEVLIGIFVVGILWIWRNELRLLNAVILIKDYIRLVMLILWGILGFVCIVARMKAGEFWKRSILWRLSNIPGRIYRKVSQVIRKLPLIRKSVLIASIITLLEFLVLCLVYHMCVKVNGIQAYIIGFRWTFAFWVLETSLLLIAFFGWMQKLQELKRAGKELAEGNSDFKIDTTFMFGDVKEHAEYLNSISEGVTRAVQEKLKSEHLKTELITNVSHDIKTPLTSLINYSDLISKEETENERIKEYAEVLYRQSCRLKKLIEDLVDASKASTGNVEINFQSCDVGVLLTQAIGEYQQRMWDKKIELIAKQPENSVYIMADSKLLWRVFDNLLTNICKYSLSGTRVYLTVEESGEQVIISFKNISEYPLNISAEELMERFVRGDRSRHTEGNGLGLNIARSLTELQNGTMELSVDGDLFKVLLEFPKLV